MRRAERLFQIIQTLRRSTRPVAGAALSAELELSTRTVYRDVADLKAQRVPITGEARLGYLLAAEYNMPPLMLTPVELEAVVLGAARDVLAKIASAVPAYLRPFIAEPSTSTEPSLNDMGEVVETASLRDAVRQRLKLRLLYCSENGERTERIGWPVALGYSDTKRVLIALCEMRQGFRHFRTDRMQAAELLNQPIGEPRGLLLQRWEAWRSAELAKTARGPEKSRARA